MITPSFSLTATERVLPRMALDFTTASLDPRVTFTRTGNTATVTDSSGVIVGINANLPRFDYNPTTLVCKGLLLEEARTNLLLNSLINGISLITQLVTTTAVAHTLSFYGTGTIVLTGTSSATVVGTGAYPSRKTLTFTPTAGVLTVTVTGTVQFAQLEVGAFATSYIPTDATSKTRNADNAVMTGTNFSSWYNASEGAVTCEWIPNQIVAAGRLFSMGSSNTNLIMCLQTATGIPQFQVIDTSVTQVSLATGGLASINNKIAISSSYKLNSFAKATQGANLQTDTNGTVPTGVNSAVIGTSFTGTQYINGCVSKIFYYPQRLINAELQAFSV
jgi:hypothetical protein